MRAVLMEGAIPQQFAHPSEALLSGCSSLSAVVSGLDDRAVNYIKNFLSGNESSDLRIVVLVHATCATKERNLFDLLSLLNRTRLTVWVLPVRPWGQRSSLVLAVRQESPNHIIWISTAGAFGLAEPEMDEAHLITEADPLIVDQFISWFSRLAAAAAPLTTDTAGIPTLVSAPGSREGAELWDQYVSRCQPVAAGAKMVTPNPALPTLDPAIPTSKPNARPTNGIDRPDSFVGQSVETLEKQIREKINIPKVDPLLRPIVQLFEQGDLVTIDKGSRIPPLEVPIKAEWFGISSFREVGVVTREVRYKISVLDEKTNSALDARRKGTSALREKFSFPLADGSRWMPHKAKPLFAAELKRHEEEGKVLLSSILSGNPEDWVQSKRDLVTRDANRQYEEFHPGKRMPDETINEILKALTERFKKAASGNFLPTVSFVKTSFRIGLDSQHVSDWAVAKTLLRAIADFPRTALKGRAYFLRGLKVSETDFLAAMNVADDHFVARWFQPESLEIALTELERLKQIDEMDLADHDKCGLILDLLHQGS